MKAKRRHELKENVLAQELGKLKHFFSKHGGWIFGTVVAAGLGFLIVWNVRARKRDDLTAQRVQYAQLLERMDVNRDERLAGFVRLAENAKDPIIAADSAIRAGNICSQQYLELLRSPAASKGRLESHRNAEKYYGMVIAQHADKKPILANAYYGLGILAENSGEKEAALARYEQAIEAGGPNHPVAVELKQRRDKLQEWFAQKQFPQTYPADSRPATSSAPGAEAPASMPAASD